MKFHWRPGRHRLAEKSYGRKRLFPLSLRMSNNRKVKVITKEALIIREATPYSAVPRSSAVVTSWKDERAGETFGSMTAPTAMN